MFGFLCDYQLFSSLALFFVLVVFITGIAVLEVTPVTAKSRSDSLQ